MPPIPRIRLLISFKHVAIGTNIGDIETPTHSSSTSQSGSSSILSTKPFLARVFTDYSIEDEAWVGQLLLLNAKSSARTNNDIAKCLEVNIQRTRRDN